MVASAIIVQTRPVIAKNVSTIILQDGLGDHSRTRNTSPWNGIPRTVREIGTMFNQEENKLNEHGSLLFSGSTLAVDYYSNGRVKPASTSESTINGEMIPMVPLTVSDYFSGLWSEVNGGDVLTSNDVSSNGSFNSIDEYNSNTINFSELLANVVPNQPVLVQPSDNSTGVTNPPTLEVSVSDPDTADDLEVSFYGRTAGDTGVGEDFTIVVYPDTQHMSESYPAAYNSMSQWIVDERNSRNIVFATHVGDIVNTASSESEWINADAAMDILDSPGIPYSVGPGNHDINSLYETYFGISRFSGKPWYGGHYGSDNSNNYSLFSASGMDFILINLQYQSTSAQLDWADALLKANPTRRAIVVQHDIIEIDNTWYNQAAFTALKDNPNLFLMLCGHRYTSSDGAAYRAELGDDGHTIHLMLANYQGFPSGGNGYLRVLHFSPAADKIYATTYSPYIDSYITSTTNYDQMEMVYDMHGTNTPYTLIGTVSGVSNGANASISWPGLAEDTEYEWFATVFDGSETVTGATWSFTTGTGSR